MLIYVVLSLLSLCVDMDDIPALHDCVLHDLPSLVWYMLLVFVELIFVSLSPIP